MHPLSLKASICEQEDPGAREKTNFDKHIFNFMYGFYKMDQYVIKDYQKTFPEGRNTGDGFLLIDDTSRSRFLFSSDV